MKTPRLFRHWFSFLVMAGATALMTRTSWGCTACFGQSDSPLAAGMNWGIFSLLGFIGLVLGGVAGFGVFLMRRAAKHAELESSSQETDFEPVSARGVSLARRSFHLRKSRQSCQATNSRPGLVPAQR